METQSEVSSQANVSKSTKQIKDAIAEYDQKLRNLIERPRHDKPSPAAGKIQSVKLSFHKKGKQVTSNLIAKITGFSVLTVEHINKAFDVAGFWKRTRIITRDELGHIKTHYEEELTELGKAWKHNRIPFYPHNPQKTIDLIEQYAKDKKHFVKEYFWERKQAKILKESRDRGGNPTHSIRRNTMGIDNKSNSKELSLLSSSETVRRIVAVYSKFLTRINAHYDSPEKANIKFSPSAEMKLCDGALLLIKHVQDNKLVLPGMMGDGWDDWAEEVCECLDMRLRKETERIYPGHFCCDALFNNWLINHCRKNGIPYHDEIENIEDVPGFKPFPGEKVRFEKQRRKEEGEDREEELMEEEGDVMDAWLDK